MQTNLELRLNARARRAAAKSGLVARKSRRCVGGPDNAGGFMLLDPLTNVPVSGFIYDLEPEAVLEYCRVEAE